MIPLIINKKETNYLIDKQGNIYNKKTNKYLKGSIKSGYKSVKLTIDGVKKDYLVHRLVAITFIPIDDMDNMQVNHKDGNRENNCLNNLEWVTSSQNILHSWKNSNRQKRKVQKSNNINILDNPNWKQYLDTNYYISNTGECVNIKTNKILNPSQTANGYLKYSLYINKRSVNILIHVLVYKLFHPEEVFHDNEQINHIDGNKKNNCIDNLEKITNSNNMLHSCYHLKQNIVQVGQYTLDNECLNIYPSISEAGRKTGYNIGGISQAINGKIKTYKGFVWKRIRLND